MTSLKKIEPGPALILAATRAIATCPGCLCKVESGILLEITRRGKRQIRLSHVKCQDIIPFKVGVEQNFGAWGYFEGKLTKENHDA